MATSTESLWGTLPTLKERVNTPKRILQEQAQILSDATQHLLVGDVRTDNDGTLIFLHLYIVAPTLNNFRVKIAMLSHDALIYPARVFNSLDGGDFAGGIPCRDEEALRLKLSEILGSEKVHSVVKSLLSQAADEVRESPPEDEDGQFG